MDQLLNTVPVNVTRDMNDAILKTFSTCGIMSIVSDVSDQGTKTGWIPGTFFSSAIGISVGRKWLRWCYGF
jgi:hypothetical protein